MNFYPEWARWIAKDENGVCWVYEVEPLQFDRGWYENELGRRAKVNCPDRFVEKHWQDSLHQLNSD